MDDLYFKMSGPIFKRGYPLDIVITGLGCLQDIIDNSYKAITSKKRLSHKDRELFRIISKDFHEGSFVAYFDIIMTSVQLAMPFIQAVGPNEIWEHTKNTYQFLKAVFTASKKDIVPQYQVNDNGTQTVILGDQNINIFTLTLDIAKLSLEPYKHLDFLLEEGKLDQVEIGVNLQPDIVLNIENKGLFEALIIIEREPVSLTGEIFDFNKYDKSGRIQTFENKHISEDTYKFRYIGEQDIEELILSMTENSIKVNCLIEKVNNPLENNKIGGLLIINIAV